MLTSNQKKNRKNLKWDFIRAGYHTTLMNLSKNAEIADKQWAMTGDISWHASYNMYVKKIIELKEKIKREEKLLFG